MHVDRDTTSSTAKQVDINQKTSLHLSPVTFLSSPRTTEVKHEEPDLQLHRTTSTSLFPSSFRKVWSES